MTNKHGNSDNPASHTEICVLKCRSPWERQQLTEMRCGVENTPVRPSPAKEALESWPREKGQERSLSDCLLGRRDPDVLCVGVEKLPARTQSAPTTPICMPHHDLALGVASVFPFIRVVGRGRKYLAGADMNLAVNKLYSALVCGS